MPVCVRACVCVYVCVCARARAHFDVPGVVSRRHGARVVHQQRVPVHPEFREGRVQPPPLGGAEQGPEEGVSCLHCYDLLQLFIPRTSFSQFKICCWLVFIYLGKG